MRTNGFDFGSSVVRPSRLLDRAKMTAIAALISYWQFLREAWKGIAPLLQPSAQVVIRIGGTRLGEEELRADCRDCLGGKDTGYGDLWGPRQFR